MSDITKKMSTTARPVVTTGSRQDSKPLVPIENRALDCIASLLFWTLMGTYTTVMLFGDIWLLPSDEMEWCQTAQMGYPDAKHYPNPDANNNPCYYERSWWLLGLNQFEVTFSRRMIVAVLLGAAIGFERKAADRPAGVRTMSLVSLGSCFFTMCGQHAFRSSPQEFDAARVSAAIPSGVGFLGSALIWKQSQGLESHEVHGLTTAASVWLSASVGIGVGGGLFILSSYCVLLVVVVLRLGPSMFFADDTSSFGDEDSDTERWSSFGEGLEEEHNDEKVLTRAEQRQMLEEHSKHSRSSRNLGMKRGKSQSSLIKKPPTFGS